MPSTTACAGSRGEADWLFDALSDATAEALVRIEDGLGLGALARGRRGAGAALAGGGRLAAAGLYHARPALRWLHGPLGERHRHDRADRGGGRRLAGDGAAAGCAGGAQHTGRQSDAARAGRDADDAQLRLPAAGHPLLRAGEAGGHLCHGHLCATACYPADKPRHPPGRPPRWWRRRWHSAPHPARCSPRCRSRWPFPRSWQASTRPP